MKHTILIPALLTIAACSTTPLKERVAGKSQEERGSYLLAKCEDESWRGHDTSKHHHFRDKPENKTHAANMVKICEQLATAPANKAKLVSECKKEAANGSYETEFYFKEHAEILTEICEAF